MERFVFIFCIIYILYRFVFCFVRMSVFVHVTDTWVRSFYVVDARGRPWVGLGRWGVVVRKVGWARCCLSVSVFFA